MLNKVDATFHNLYATTLDSGRYKASRTGLDTYALPAQMMRFDCSEGRWPILSTRQIFTKSFIHEMLQFISGKSSIKYLRDHKVGIWDSWFIKGSDVYDEPREPYTLQERVDLCFEDTVPMPVWDIVTDKPVFEPSQSLRLINLQGVIAKVDVADEMAEQIHTLLDASIKRFKVDGGTPISLKRRLTRVSKNDLAKWDRINEYAMDPNADLAIETPGGSIDFGPSQEITVFYDGKFLDIKVHPTVAQAIWIILDELKVPAYELLDADIGQGSYGVQWRRWQDTHIVETDAEHAAYFEQGYEFKGWISNSGYGPDQAIFHRDIDQLQNVIDKLKTDPDDRRMIVTAHNPGRTWQAALPPCHLYFQFFTWEMDIHGMEAAIKAKGKLQQYANSVLKLSGQVIDDQASLHKHVKAFCIEHGVPFRKITMFVLLRSFN